jgi:hypothetical protein
MILIRCILHRWWGDPMLPKERLVDEVEVVTVSELLTGKRRFTDDDLPLKLGPTEVVRTLLQCRCRFSVESAAHSRIQCSEWWVPCRQLQGWFLLRGKNQFLRGHSQGNLLPLLCQQS